MTVSEAFKFALQKHQEGNLAEAEQIYQKILAIQPDHADSLHLLGVIAQQMGKYDVGADMIRKAIALEPNTSIFYSNLGIALFKMNRFSEAVDAYRGALQLTPDYPEALNNLGNTLAKVGRYDEAISAIRRAIELNPKYAMAYKNLGTVLRERGQLDESISACRQAIAINSEFVDAYNNLSVTLLGKGLRDEAVDICRKAIIINPRHASTYLNLGNALMSLKMTDEAIATYRQAIEIDPNVSEFHSNLGSVLWAQGQVEEALNSFRTAVELDLQTSKNNKNLSALNTVKIHSYLLYVANFHPEFTAQALAEENRLWKQLYADPIKTQILPHTNNTDPERRLRVGYVSPDFYFQAETFFTIPLLESHDHNTFEIYCYSSVLSPDLYTDRIRKCADVWRDVRTESDETLSQIIRSDGIDILVDLTMHMGNNRALLFARKPAPVQICWLAYPGSSGLDTMDYRFTDAYMDPLDSDTTCYTEQSLRLPDCWVVYDPLIEVCPRSPEQKGPITFGSLNNPGKMNDALLALWAKALQATPGSHLTLLVLSVEHRQRISNKMERMGISADRLHFVGRMDRLQYLRSYDHIDIVLDPLPYNGITTTCDALYMGVPVITLAGQTASGRAGKAMLNMVGLSDLVAHTTDEFVQKTAELAANVPRLVQLRSNLRHQMINSPLMDAPRFARNIEAAYRMVWRKWCSGMKDKALQTQ